MKTSGVTFEKYANGNIKAIIINYKKHGEQVLPFLESIGAVEEDEFDKRLKNEKLYTGEELKAEVKKRIKTWWGK